MKNLIFIALAFFSIDTYAANCTQTNRNNYSAFQVLKASDLNTDFNQMVNKLNSFDGGCVADGSLELSSLNVNDFSAVTNGIAQGCPLLFVDSNTVAVGKCILSVNGKLVRTITQTNVTWGCTGCAAEVVDKLYYVYAKSGSSGVSLNLLISTTAPGTDGYDEAGNKILGAFFNNFAMDIKSTGLLSWSTNSFTSPDRAITIPRASTGVDFFAFIFQGPGGPCTSGMCTVGELFGQGSVVSVERTGTGTYSAILTTQYDFVRCLVNYSKSGSVSSGTASNLSAGTIAFFAKNSSDILTDYAGSAFCWGQR